MEPLEFSKTSVIRLPRKTTIRSVNLFLYRCRDCPYKLMTAFLEQIPPKVAARPAVQSARVSSIEVFIDEECAEYVI